MSALAFKIATDPYVGVSASSAFTRERLKRDLMFTTLFR